MVANLDLAPSEWEAHENYPHNLLLLRSHQGFRKISRDVRDRSREGTSNEAVIAIFRWWKAGMRSHERYEERKLYPYLEHRWGLSCDALAAGHELLAEADQAVFGAEPGELADAIQHHHNVLLEHLDLEEKIVVPALLALSREQFDVYCESSLRLLLEQVPCHSAGGCRNCSLV